MDEKRNPKLLINPIQITLLEIWIHGGNLKINKQGLNYLLKLFLGIILLFAMFAYTDIDKSVSILLKINLAFIAIAFVSHGTSWIFRAMRIKAIFRDYDIATAKTIDIYKINFAGNTLNIVLPFKLGDIAQIYLFHTESKVGLKESATSVIYTRIFDILALSLFGLASIALILTSNTSPEISSYSIIFLILPVMLIILTSSRVQEKIAKLAEINRPRIALIIRSFKLSKRCRIKSLIYSVLTWLADGMTTYFIFKGLDQNIPLSVIFLGLVVANIMKSFPTTPGGIGLFEGSMAFVFMSFGINQNIALVTSTMDHFIKNITTLVFGIPSLMSYKYNIDNLRKMSKDIKKKVFKSGKK